LAQNDRSVDDIIDDLDPNNSVKDDDAIMGTLMDNTSQAKSIAAYYFQYDNRNTILTTND
jgi:hypothetical protein